MAGWKEILLDVLKLIDEVKRLNTRTEKLSDRTLAMVRRLVQLETMVEIAKLKPLPNDTAGHRADLPCPYQKCHPPLIIAYSNEIR